MKRARWVVGGSALLLFVACGGSSFTTNGEGSDGGANGDGSASGSGSGGSSSGSTSSGSSSGSGSGSSGASSGSGSNGGGSNGGSSGGGSSNGGGSSGSSGASGGGSSGGADGGSDGGTAPGPCPSTVPSSGASCKPAGLECEYGDGDVQSCDTVASCSAQGAWSIQGPSLNDCGANTNASCPATYSAVPKGSSCTPNGLICNYLVGRCECTSGPGVIHVIDGSVAATWYCQSPSATGCPQRRPLLGSTCTTPSLTCDYGSCYIEGGTTETCTNGVWTAATTLCPG